MATAALKARKRRWALSCVLLLAAGALCSCWIWIVLFPGPVVRGQAAYRRGDWNTTAKLAQERLQTSRDDDQAMRLLGRASARLGNFSQARGVYARVRLQDFEAEDYYLLGMTLLRSGQFDAAQKNWSSALSLDPGHTEALFQMAQLALDRGQTTLATQVAERLAARPGWEVRGDLLLGMSRASAHHPEAATEALRRALGRDPDARLAPSVPFSAQKLLARTLLQTGLSGQARELLQSILAGAPDHEASWLLSRACLQEGALTEAETALAQAGSYRSDHPMEHEPSPYIGESRCGECHRPITQSMFASRHARTLLRGEQLASLPLPDHPLADPDDPRVSHTFMRAQGQIRMETRVESKVFRAVVDYALGAPDRYASLIGRDEQGQARTLRLSLYHNAKESGWDRTKNLPAHPARSEEYLGEALDTSEGAGECLTCHTTTVRSVQEASGLESKDKAIGCERCHGPGELHLAAIKAKFPDPVIASPVNAPPAAINQQCARCHAQHFLAMPASRSDPAWARFPSSNLPWSRCFTESGGVLNCVTCHDPHRDAETFAEHYEKKCLSCHASSAPLSTSVESGPAFRSPCPVSPTRNCLQCHMQKVPYARLHTSFTDHYIRVPESRNQPDN
jgi:tetratricopeptide (TPR) repeat protein